VWHPEPTTGDLILQKKNPVRQLFGKAGGGEPGVNLCVDQMGMKFQRMASVSQKVR